LLLSSRRYEPALLQLPPLAVGLEQRILRISKLLRPIVAQPAKCVQSLCSRSASSSQFEADLGAVLLHGHAEGVQGLVREVDLS
jgi:hypothetical protein